VGGLHNVYNAVAAIAAAEAIGIKSDRWIPALEGYKPRFGRNEVLQLDGRPLWLTLIKNPSGANVVIEEVLSDRRVGTVVVSVSDQTADGRDISWIWDADFERLVRRGIPMFPSGRRAADVAVRLKYAGARLEGAWPHPLAAIRAAQVACPPDRFVVVLATYTAMLDVRQACTSSRSGRVLDSGDEIGG
jgi:UDP-N-acetylmuramyl tripeptide synthase